MVARQHSAALEDHGRAVVPFIFEGLYSHSFRGRIQPRGLLTMNRSMMGALDDGKAERPRCKHYIVDSCYLCVAAKDGELKALRVSRDSGDGQQPEDRCDIVDDARTSSPSCQKNRPPSRRPAARIMPLADMGMDPVDVCTLLRPERLFQAAFRPPSSPSSDQSSANSKDSIRSRFERPIVVEDLTET
jgi:hypothetical protein